ncbi:protein ImuB [Conyzicola lurida]|uniref:Protein ImuB n=1 Tax=Conyzicola lurida TaxID=1172621 RepID=A0A841AN97_9MICO|nr:DNA polymerase Y family protein [Conyzicola lurida]MBB5843103.1 protein ImuB [Conyzicola lurida]
MSESTRTMVLWSPDWPVTAATRDLGLASGTAVALIDKGVVFACSEAARREGVKRGIRVREAQARCGDLLVLPHRPEVDNREFEPVIAEVERMAPGVQLLRPGSLAIRSRGPARYYGGEKPAALALIGVLAELGIGGARVGVADGPFTAEQAARSAETVRIVAPGTSAAFLAPLPLAVFDQPELAVLLQRLGIRTLGAFATLEGTDVRDRFGSEGARAHALARGLDARLVSPRVPPKQLEQSVDFEPPLDRIDQVTFGVLGIADAFITGLIAAKLVCTGIRIDIESDAGELSGRSWLHPRSFTASEVVDRVRWQLQGGAAESGLSSGIMRVTITPESVDSVGNHEEGLWGTGPDERIHHGLSRVQGMLGHEGVLTAVVGGGRTLADRATLVAWGDRAPVPAARPWPGQLPQPAPATVFPTAHPVHVFAAGGDAVTVDERGALSAAPLEFGASGRLRRVAAWAGPWIVDERWWDAQTRQRASRFQLVDDDGIAWLLAFTDPHWIAEARYD